MNLKKYRIIKDQWNYYNPQIWRAWFPFWCDLYKRGAERLREDAENQIRNHKNPVVWTE